VAVGVAVAVPVGVGGGVWVKLGVMVGVAVSVGVAVWVAVAVGGGVLVPVAVGVRVGKDEFLRVGVGAVSFKTSRNSLTHSLITPCGVGVEVGRRGRVGLVSSRPSPANRLKSRSMVAVGLGVAIDPDGFELEFAAFASKVESPGTGAGEVEAAAGFWILPAAGISTTWVETGPETPAAMGESSAGIELACSPDGAAIDWPEVGFRGKAWVEIEGVAGNRTSRRETMVGVDLSVVLTRSGICSVKT
jgi:hypothetical protein